MDRYVWIRVVTPEWEYTERMGRPLPVETPGPLVPA